MKSNKIYIASVIKNGILGGWITAYTDKLVFETGKISIPKEIKRIVIHYNEISQVNIGSLFLLPKIRICMNNSDVHRFIIFARKSFLKTLNERCSNIQIQ